MQTFQPHPVVIKGKTIETKLFFGANLKCLAFMPLEYYALIFFNIFRWVFSFVIISVYLVSKTWKPKIG